MLWVRLARISTQTIQFLSCTQSVNKELWFQYIDSEVSGQDWANAEANLSLSKVHSMLYT